MTNATDTPTRDDLDELGRDELYERARALEADGVELDGLSSRSTKGDLVDMLAAHYEGGDGGAGPDGGEQPGAATGQVPGPPGQMVPGTPLRTARDMRRTRDDVDRVRRDRAERVSRERPTSVDEADSGKRLGRTVVLMHPLTSERVTILADEPVPGWALDPESGPGSYIANPKAFRPFTTQIDEPTFDVPTSNVEAVVAWVEAAPVGVQRRRRARMATERELQRDQGPRQKLVNALDRLVAANSGQFTE